MPLLFSISLLAIEDNSMRKVPIVTVSFLRMASLRLSFNCCLSIQNAKNAAILCRCVFVLNLPHFLVVFVNLLFLDPSQRRLFKLLPAFWLDVKHSPLCRF